MLIEIQFRTHLQHLWATAVETYGLFTKRALKSGQGMDYEKRFFALVSSLFALEENCPVVPNTVSDREALISELKGIDEEHHMLEQLNAIRAASYVHDQINGGVGFYLLVLNYNTQRLRVQFFPQRKIDLANKIYEQIEANDLSSEKIDVVLVNARSFNTLKAAYKNYFSDISEFLQKVDQYLKE